MNAHSRQVLPLSPPPTRKKGRNGGQTISQKCDPQPENHKKHFVNSFSKNCRHNTNCCYDKAKGVTKGQLASLQLAPTASDTTVFIAFGQIHCPMVWSNISHGRWSLTCTLWMWKMLPQGQRVLGHQGGMRMPGALPLYLVSYL